MLTPVPFTKGRATAPRLSEPYVPGKHDPRFWTEGEIAVVRENYGARGAGYCLSRLPGRTLTGVYQRASLFGLRTPARGTRAPHIGAALDDIIRERWPELAGRGAVAAFARELGIVRATLSRRALLLGLTLPHRKERPWTAAEEALLPRAPVNDPKAAAAFFAANGFRRSPAAITVRCTRLGVSRRRRDVLSAHGAARILGIDDKTMAIHCAEGRVVAMRRGTDRLPQQGGDTWTIQPADLRRFVVDELDRLDIRKVDKHAFVALLTGALDPRPNAAAPITAAEDATA